MEFPLVLKLLLLNNNPLNYGQRMCFLIAYVQSGHKLGVILKASFFLS